MAGRKKSKRTSKRGRKPARRAHHKSLAGLTRKQLIARLRAATKGKATKRKKRRAKHYGPKRPSKSYLAGVRAARGAWERSGGGEAGETGTSWEDAESSKFNDLGRRRRKAKKGGKKSKKRALSAWQRFIKSNKNRRGMRKKNGMLNLRALAAAYHKSPAGRKTKKAAKKAPKRRKASHGGKRKHHRAKKRSSRRDYGWY